MGSKKHKKESKKKKHKSRSRSPLDGEERERSERKRHKKHKDRKKDRSPDVEEVPVDSHLQKAEGNGDAELPARSRSASKERDRRMREQRRHDKEKEEKKEKEYHREKEEKREKEYHREKEDKRDKEYHREKEDKRDKEYHREKEDKREKEYHREKEDKREKERVRSSSPGAGGGAQDSMSIEESNRLRAKLGLKPLEVHDKPAAEDGKLKDDLGEFYHKPAANISQQKKTEKIRQKLEERKEKRKLEQKLKTKTLGEESDEDDAAAWVQRSRAIDKQKQEAAKRAAMLDEMDAVFGVSALVAEEEQETRAQAYSAGSLRGLRVAHDIDSLGEERETILTLADKPVLADDAEDVLVNVNIVDDEKYKKNIAERKKAKAGYQAYDDEAELEAALGFQKPVLAKYDDEIHPHRPGKERGFFIGDEAALEAKKFRDMMRQERLQGGGGVERRLESLQLPAPRLASDYLDVDDLHATFKKPKKRGKMRKKPKQEPIDVDNYDAATAPLITDDTEAVVGGGSPVRDEEETEPDSELQAALARARRLRHKERPPPHTAPPLEVKEEVAVKEEETSSGMVLDATAEFCRTLGDIPTYGQAGNRDHHSEIMELERAELDVAAEGAEGAGGAWSRVDVGSDQPPDLAAGGAGVALGAEPALGAGVAGALQLALSKGYLERCGAAPAPRANVAHLLQAAHYSIEDKTYGGEDDKHGRRERGGHSGPLVEFREKGSFRPNIKLEYVDDDGRPLCPKEAFRYLSHKFHGKGPGKNKQEKRIKKAVQEGLMKKMSSTDTPLNTLQMLQDKQRETHSPYIVLSGAKRETNN